MRPASALFALLLGLLLAACDGDEPRPTPTPSTATPIATIVVTPTLSPITATPEPETPTPTQTASPTPTATPAPPTASRMPDRDPLELAVRLGGHAAPLPTRVAQPIDRVEGARESFFVLEVAGPSITSVTAILQRVSDHAYFYFEEGLEVSDAELDAAADGFERVVYPLITDHFGPDTGPGIDGDSRIAILHANVPGVGGYFSDQDALPRVVSPFSNQRRLIVLNSSGLYPGSTQYLGILAHELQHLVHNDLDPSEDSWVNEGLAEVANYAVSGSFSLIPAFLDEPDLQLNDWGDTATTAHYGASGLFIRYLLNRTGGTSNARSLVAEPADGIDGVEAYLAAVNSGLSFEELFLDWVVANFLDLPGEGPYSHRDSDFTAAPVTATANAAAGEDTVAQFGTDYLVFDGEAGRLLIEFDGAETVGVIPEQPPAGGEFWFSGRGDSIDARLTREFDLSGVARATLRFRTWYQVERGWDYGYVTVSADGGVTWEVVRSTGSRELDPVGLAYGPAFTGDSGGWVEEMVDLTPFAGGEILVRFEYITDEATNLGGWAIADVAIPEIGFMDGDDGAAGWLAEGFQPFAGPLAQRFGVQVIVERDDGPEVLRMALDAGNAGSVTIAGLGDTVGRVILAVSGLTDGTNIPALYRYAFVTE